MATNDPNNDNATYAVAALQDAFARRGKAERYEMAAVDGNVHIVIGGLEVSEALRTSLRQSKEQNKSGSSVGIPNKGLIPLEHTTIEFQNQLESQSAGDVSRAENLSKLVLNTEGGFPAMFKRGSLSKEFASDPKTGEVTATLVLDGKHLANRDKIAANLAEDQKNPSTQAVGAA